MASQMGSNSNLVESYKKKLKKVKKKGKELICTLNKLSA